MIDNRKRPQSQCYKYEARIWAYVHLTNTANVQKKENGKSMSVRHSADQGQTVATAYMKVCHISFMVLLPQ